jgi:hypothetical protein
LAPHPAGPATFTNIPSIPSVDPFCAMHPIPSQIDEIRTSLFNTHARRCKTQMKQKRAALYVRVSTGEQHTEAQERALRDYVFETKALASGGRSGRGRGARPLLPRPDLNLHRGVLGEYDLAPSRDEV